MLLLWCLLLLLLLLLLQLLLPLCVLVLVLVEANTVDPTVCFTGLIRRTGRRRLLQDTRRDLGAVVSRVRLRSGRKERRRVPRPDVGLCSDRLLLAALLTCCSSDPP